MKNGYLDIGTAEVAIGCNHKKNTTACGGCYARLDRAIDKALEQLREGTSPQSVIDTLNATVMQRMAEKKTPGLDTKLHKKRCTDTVCHCRSED